jgi:serine/threonine protein kinase
LDSREDVERVWLNDKSLGLKSGDTIFEVVFGKHTRKDLTGVNAFLAQDHFLNQSKPFLWGNTWSVCMTLNPKKVFYMNASHILKASNIIDDRTNLFSLPIPKGKLWGWFCFQGKVTQEAENSEYFKFSDSKYEHVSSNVIDAITERLKSVPMLRNGFFYKSDQAKDKVLFHSHNTEANGGKDGFYLIPVYLATLEADISTADDEFMLHEFRRAGESIITLAPVNDNEELCVCPPHKQVKLDLVPTTVRINNDGLYKLVGIDQNTLETITFESWILYGDKLLKPNFDLWNHCSDGVRTYENMDKELKQWFLKPSPLSHPGDYNSYPQTKKQSSHKVVLFYEWMKAKFFGDDSRGCTFVPVGLATCESPVTTSKTLTPLLDYTTQDMTECPTTICVSVSSAGSGWALRKRYQHMQAMVSGRPLVGNNMEWWTERLVLPLKKTWGDVFKSDESQNVLYNNLDNCVILEYRERNSILSLLKYMAYNMKSHVSNDDLDRARKSLTLYAAAGEPVGDFVVAPLQDDSVLINIWLATFYGSMVLGSPIEVLKYYDSSLCINISIQLGTVLGNLHNKGYEHNSFTPENILMGEDEKLKLISCLGLTRIPGYNESMTLLGFCRLIKNDGTQVFLEENTFQLWQNCSWIDFNRMETAYMSVFGSSSRPGIPAVLKELEKIDIQKYKTSSETWDVLDSEGTQGSVFVSKDQLVLKKKFRYIPSYEREKRLLERLKAKSLHIQNIIGEDVKEETLFLQYYNGKNLSQWSLDVDRDNVRSMTKAQLSLSSNEVLNKWLSEPKNDESYFDSYMIVFCMTTHEPQWKLEQNFENILKAYEEVKVLRNWREFMYKGKHTNVDVRNNLCRQLLEAVQCMELHNVLHMDIKPDNIMVTGTDEDLRLVLIDFGASMDVGDIRRPNDEVVGTPYFLAPEYREATFNKPPFRRTGKYNDLWTMGSVMFSIQTGHFLLSMLRASVGLEPKLLQSIMLETCFNSNPPENVRALLRSPNSFANQDPHGLSHTWTPAAWETVVEEACKFHKLDYNMTRIIRSCHRIDPHARMFARHMTIPPKGP